MDVEETVREDTDWIEMTQHEVQLWAVVST
jgi:hypothetical protein